MVPWTHLILHPKRHLDRISRFCMGPKCYAVHCIVTGEDNPQNCFFSLGFRHPAEGGPSHGDRQHAQKCGKDRVCGSGDMIADRQTDTQTCSLQYFATAPAGEVINIIKTKHIYSVPKDKTISENIPLHITIARDMVSVSDVWVSKPSRDPQRSRFRTFGSRAHVRK